MRFISVILISLVLFASNVTAGWYKVWPYRQAVTLQSSAISGSTNLMEFPALIIITNAANPIFSKAQSDGDDLVFTSEDGETLLSYQIEKFDATPGNEYLAAWVRIPSLSTANDTTIYMYYGNASVSSRADTTGGTWTNYAGVWHLNETNTTTGTYNDVLDSTANGNGGEQKNGVDLNVTGIIGSAASFDDSVSNVIEMAADSSLALTNDLTISAWFKTSTDTTGGLIGRWTWWGSAAYGVSLYGSGYEFILRDTNGYDRIQSTAGGYNDGNWHQYVGVANSTSGIFSLYIDGSFIGSKGYNGTIFDNSTYTVSIGRWYGNDQQAHFDGIIDECRICSLPRNADWVKTEYDMITTPAQFATPGTEENIPASTDDWYAHNWQYRKKILLNSSYISGSSTLHYFPALVALDGDEGSNVWANAKSDGSDIVFTEADGTGKLHHEIESYDATSGSETMRAWVLLPSLAAANDTTIYMYYGNASASNQADTTGGTWTNYAGVWHLSETNTTTGPYNDVLDSTANGNDGEQKNGVALNVPGLIGSAASFDDSVSNVIEMAADSSLALTNDLTISAWFKTSTDTTGGLIGRWTSWGSAAYGVSLYGGGYEFVLQDTDGYDRVRATVGGYNDGNWHQYVGVANSTSGIFSLYIDGSFIGSKSYNGTIFDHISYTVSIGRGYGNDQQAHFDGIIDEGRICNVPRNADWIKTEYDIISAPKQFAIWGIDEPFIPKGSVIIIK